MRFVSWCHVFLKMGHSRPFFIYFHIFYLQLVDKMSGFEPRISGVRSNHSTNWATTTAPADVMFVRQGPTKNVEWWFSIFPLFSLPLIFAGKQNDRSTKMTFLAEKNDNKKDFFLIAEKKRVGVSFLLERLFDQFRADLSQINMRQMILHATLADKALF